MKSSVRLHEFFMATRRYSDFRFLVTLGEHYYGHRLLRKFCARNEVISEQLKQFALLMPRFRHTLGLYASRFFAGSNITVKLLFRNQKFSISDKTVEEATRQSYIYSILFQRSNEHYFLLSGTLCSTSYSMIFA